MEPFTPGDPVTLTETDHAMGRVVSVSDDGTMVEVRWHRRPGHDYEVTLESVETIRRIHESEEGML